MTRFVSCGAWIWYSIHTSTFGFGWRVRRRNHQFVIGHAFCHDLDAIHVFRGLRLVIVVLHRLDYRDLHFGQFPPLDVQLAIGVIETNSAARRKVHAFRIDSAGSPTETSAGPHSRPSDRDNLQDLPWTPVSLPARLTSEIQSAEYPGHPAFC